MELVTAHLSLAPLDIRRDAPDLHVAYSDPLVMGRWLNEAPAADVEMTADRLRHRSKLDGAALWTVRRRGDDLALGLVERVGGTSPPGLSWMLRRSAWGQGIMGEAAPAVVEHLLRADGGADMVEVWADAGNVASIRVALRAGLTERARFARRADGQIRETLVLVRLREERPQDWYAADTVLPVQDVAVTEELLSRALGWHPGFRVGDPPVRVGLRLSPWSGSPGVQLVAAEPGTICPVTVYLHAGVQVSELYARAEAAGAGTEGPPAAMPWGRTEFWIRLAEQHRLCVSGPV